MTMLEPFGTRINLRDEVRRTLQAAIVAGELRPGVVYSAPSLAAQFGTSATPVREAMLDLVKEGLVETVRNKGFRIVALSEDELDDITSLRALIEVPTVREVARRGVAAPVLKQLRTLARDLVATARAGDVVGHNRADLEFHLTLLAESGNATLVETVRTLRTRARLYGQAALAERGELIDSAREHGALLDLVEAGDAAGAGRLMQQHIGHVRGAWR